MRTRPGQHQVELGRFGKLHVRHGKGARGSGPRERMVPQTRWAKEAPLAVLLLDIEAELSIWEQGRMVWSEEAFPVAELAYHLTLRQLAPLFGISKPAADHIIDHLGPLLALRSRRRFRQDAVLIVDGTLVPTHDHMVAEQSKNYRYSTNHQVVIDADTRLVVMVGRPLPGNRHDCKAWELSGAKSAVGCTTVIVDGGYRGCPCQKRHPSWWEPVHRASRNLAAVA